MYLNNKQLFTLIFPFLFSVVIYFFDVEIVSNIRYLFPVYEEYSNKTLSEKTDSYLQIETKYKLYQGIKEKLELRKTNAPWIVQNVFYNKEGITPINAQQEIEIQDSNAQEVNTKQVAKKPYVFKLEVVYPNKKIAIINGLIVKEGAVIHGAKVIKIENNRVLLEHQKGVQWLSLFQ